MQQRKAQQSDFAGMMEHFDEFVRGCVYCVHKRPLKPALSKVPTERAGEPFEVEVDLTHMNPRGRGKVVAPQWSKVLSAEATTSEAVASLAGVTVVNAENARVRLKVVPRKDLRGFLYVPVKVTTETGTGVVDVIAKVIP